MSDKQKLLQEAQKGHAELQQSFAGLDDAQAGRVWLGTWGVREIVGHASGWLQAMKPALERIGRGEPPYPAGTYDDYDAWNAKFVDARRGIKIHDLGAELERSHREFIAAAEALPDEHFAAGATARGVVEGTSAQHYAEHAAQIREWRATM
jgi:uncharacterized protein DUF1706